MTTKHTPGPWALQKFGDNYCLTAQYGMREIILAARGRKMVMNNDGILRPIKPHHPNAKLIAAAPDLLEALQRLIDVYSATLIEEFSHDPEKDEDIIFAKTAIKRATE